MKRVSDALNKPSVVLVVGVVLVAINVFFYFGYYLTKTPMATASSPPIEGVPFIAYSPPDSPTEQSPTDKSSTDKSPTDKSPTDKSPTDKSPTDKSPPEKAPPEQAPPEQAPTELAPTEQAPPEQAPI